MPLAFESPPLSEAVLQQVTTEKRGAVLTGSTFSMPPDQCTGTADDLMNNTGRRLPMTLPCTAVQSVSFTSFILWTIKVVWEELTADFRS